MKLDWFHSLWTEKFDIDPRGRNDTSTITWLLTTTFPNHIQTIATRHNSTSSTGSTVHLALGYVPLYPLFWIQCFLWLSIQSIINICIAIVIYVGIHQNQYPTGGGGGGRATIVPSTSASAYLLGYGCICPFLIYLPFYLIPYFQIQNTACMMCIGGANAAILLFRCLETMHGTIPIFATQSFTNFILYYATSIQLQFDPITNEPILFTWKHFLERIGTFTRLFMEATFLYSIVWPNYTLFPSSYQYNHTISTTTTISNIILVLLRDLFYWGNIANNYVIALLTSITLEAGYIGLGILTSLLTGICTEKFNDKPLSCSSSPSNFWSHRWDKAVTDALRRGVFRPLRNAGTPRWIATLITFAISGLLHEYILFVMTLRVGPANNPTRTHYQPDIGLHLLFFLWNGSLLLSEYIVSQHLWVQWIHKHCPQPIQTTLVLLLVLPISHIFTNEWIRSGFYSDISFGFPRIIWKIT